MSFSILALVSTRDSHIKPDCEAGGMLPGPIWEMPCNDLFITYFEADEMRIYVKHNCNINLFHNKHYILKFNKFILQTMYVILIIILTKIQQSSRIFVPFFSIQYRLTDDWIDFKPSSSYSSFFCDIRDKQIWPSIDWAPLPVYPQSPSAHCSLVAAPIIFRSLFGFILFHIINTMIRIVIGNL
jgi:hypothetical protein